MRRIALLLLVLVLAGAPRAAAQALFSNPFASAEKLIADRGGAPPASLRLRYAATRGREGEAARQSEVVFDVAPDWVLIREGDNSRVLDLRLERIFQLGENGQEFTSSSLLGFVYFLIAERQNRRAVNEVIRASGAGPEGCDVDVELGVAIPSLRDTGVVSLRDNNTRIDCDGRRLVRYEASVTSAPAALWPAVAFAMNMHPTLRPHMEATGKAPSLIEARLRVMTGVLETRTWRLLEAQTSNTPYPLAPQLRNATAARLNADIAANVGTFAAAAVAGTAAGGAPTLAQWDMRLRSLDAARGRGAATIQAIVGASIFPDSFAGCPGSGRFACTLLAELQTTARQDAALGAYLQVVAAEREGPASAIVQAMRAAQSSPDADDPALGATFALALEARGDELAVPARAAGLQTDIKALHVRAIEGYPYAPAYWTDLGDFFARDYEHVAAFAMYDVAFSLPTADARHLVLAPRRAGAQRVRTDFPAFFARP